MSYSVHNHRLLKAGTPVAFHASPNQGGAVKRSYLILHYTAGATGAGAVSWLTNPKAKASAHLVLDRNGSVTQLVPFDRIAWHAGESKWGSIVGLNAHSIGIEIVNRGKLRRSEAGDWKDWSGRAVPPDEVVVAQHKHESAPAGWHTFTEEEIEEVVEIGLALHEKYEFLDVLGHEDIAPVRKVDPGPAFPLASIAAKILGRQ